jgi:hypothetical protein
MPEKQLPVTISRLERGVSVPAEYQPPDGNGTPAVTFASAARSVVADIKDVAQGADDISLDLSMHKETDGRVTAHLSFRAYRYRNEAGK